MKKRNKIKTIVVGILLHIFLLGFAPTMKSFATFDSYEDQQLFESLIEQGYSVEVAADEVWERKGQPDVYGTGGIDGISTYGTCDFGGGVITTKPSTPTTGHTHIWGEGVVIKEPTCTEEGTVKFTCSCGQTKTDKLPKVDHKYESVETPATCTEYRKIVYTCSECGDVLTIEYPDEGYADHIYIPSEDSVEATCEEKGLMIYVCNVCGDTYTEEVEAKGHQFTKYTVEVEPGCLTPGKKSIFCDECGALQEGSTVEIPATGHVEKVPHDIVAATFWKDGLETVFCESCDKKIAETVIPAKGGIFRFLIPSAGAAFVVAFIVILAINRKRKMNI